MKAFSLFSGIGGFDIALERAGIEIVGHAEINKYAEKIYTRHFKNKNWGDVSKIDAQKLPDFDILVGGSPCQDLSIANTNRKGLKGKKSILFWEFSRILKTKKPKYFIFENVYSIKDIDQHIISKELGVYPVMIDSALLTAQRRKRYFWTNIGSIIPPQDKGLVVKDILEPEDKINKKYFLSDREIDYMNRPGSKTERTNWAKHTSWTEDKGHTVIANYCRGIPHNTLRVGTIKELMAEIGKAPRKFTPVECERLQGFDEGWTEGISETQRYKCLGNAVTVPVIEHILSYLNSDKKIEFFGKMI
jgi:DNA (cytosine-5)-methyltransferase 3A